MRTWLAVCVGLAGCPSKGSVPPAEAPAVPDPTPDANGPECFPAETPAAQIAVARRASAVAQEILWKDLSPPQEAWTTCAADADCETVSIECCDVCNGGRLVSVARTALEAAKAAYPPGDCANVACTERACEPAVPLCEAGHCTYYPSWVVPMACVERGMR